MNKKMITAGLSLAALLALILPVIDGNGMPGAGGMLMEAKEISVLCVAAVCLFLVIAAAAVPVALFGNGKVFGFVGAGMCFATLLSGVYLMFYTGDFRLPQIGGWIFAALELGAVISGLIQTFYMVDDAPEQTRGGRIIIEFGMMAGAELYPPDQETLTIGRAASMCNLVVNGQGISRRHCQVTYRAESNSYVVQDLSKNGTWMSNGRQIPPGTPVELMAGSMIYLALPDQRIRLG